MGGVETGSKDIKSLFTMLSSEEIMLKSTSQ